MTKMTNSKDSKKKKQNEILALDIERSSEAHIRYITYVIMLESLDRISCAKLRGHFRNLTMLTGLTFLKTCIAAGFMSGYFRAGAQDTILAAFNSMLAQVRP